MPFCQSLFKWKIQLNYLEERKKIDFTCLSGRQNVALKRELSSMGSLLLLPHTCKAKKKSGKRWVKIHFHILKMTNMSSDKSCEICIFLSTQSFPPHLTPIPATLCAAKGAMLVRREGRERKKRTSSLSYVDIKTDVCNNFLTSSEGWKNDEILHKSLSVSPSFRPSTDHHRLLHFSSVHQVAAWSTKRHPKESQQTFFHAGYRQRGRQSKRRETGENASPRTIFSSHDAKRPFC